jgi:uncharacterized metal-binding protein YceD (DUF177 family)
VVSLVGLASERRGFDVVVPAIEFPGLVPEYRRDVRVSGTVAKSGRKLHLQYTINTVADLVCDRSLEEYEEPISVVAALDYALDGELFARQQGTEVEPDEIRGLREDAQEIDLTDDVRQDLAIALPMKRVAPAYRDKEISELIPPGVSPSAEPDERWAALRNLKY